MTKKYDILTIDPPWPQQKGGRRKVRPKQGRNLDYWTIPIERIFEILDNEIFPLASQNHTVFIWTIDRFLTQCEFAMRNRAYKLHARLIWNKLNGPAPAYSIRYCHEYCLWYYKPSFMKVRKDFQGKFTSIFSEKSREHSRKPDHIYKLIDLFWPGLNKIDVFSREKRYGWDQWGNQVNYFKKD